MLKKSILRLFQHFVGVLGIKYAVFLFVYAMFCDRMYQVVKRLTA